MTAKSVQAKRRPEDRRQAGAKLLLPRAGRRGGAVTPREFLDAASGVDELLLAGKEGMAGGADADLNVLLGGTSVIDRSAGAGNLGLAIIRVNVRFHGKTWADKVARRAASATPRLTDA